MKSQTTIALLILLFALSFSSCVTTKKKYSVKPSYGAYYSVEVKKKTRLNVLGYLSYLASGIGVIAVLSADENPNATADDASKSQRVFVSLVPAAVATTWLATSKEDKAPIKESDFNKFKSKNVNTYQTVSFQNNTLWVINKTQLATHVFKDVGDYDYYLKTFGMNNLGKIVKNSINVMDNALVKRALSDRRGLSLDSETVTKLKSRTEEFDYNNIVNDKRNIDYDDRGEKGFVLCVKFLSDYPESKHKSIVEIFLFERMNRQFETKEFLGFRRIYSAGVNDYYYVCSELPYLCEKAAEMCLKQIGKTKTVDSYLLFTQKFPTYSKVKEAYDILINNMNSLSNFANIMAVGYDASVKDGDRVVKYFRDNPSDLTRLKKATLGCVKRIPFVVSEYLTKFPTDKTNAEKYAFEIACSESTNADDFLEYFPNSTFKKKVIECCKANLLAYNKRQTQKAKLNKSDMSTPPFVLISGKDYARINNDDLDTQSLWIHVKDGGLFSSDICPDTYSVTYTNAKGDIDTKTDPFNDNSDFYHDRDEWPITVNVYYNPDDDCDGNKKRHIQAMFYEIGSYTINIW